MGNADSQYEEVDETQRTQESLPHSRSSSDGTNTNVSNGNAGLSSSEVPNSTEDRRQRRRTSTSEFLRDATSELQDCVPPKLETGALDALPKSSESSPHKLNHPKLPEAPLGRLGDLKRLSPKYLHTSKIASDGYSSPSLLPKHLNNRVDLPDVSPTHLNFKGNNNYTPPHSTTTTRTTQPTSSRSSTCVLSVLTRNGTVLSVLVGFYPIVLYHSSLQSEQHPNGRSFSLILFHRHLETANGRRNRIQSNGRSKRVI